jgi:acyl-CoA oxidase
MIQEAILQLCPVCHYKIYHFTGGYISGSEPPRMIQEAILQLCSELKDDSVALADAIAPTDFILNSPIGKSDGQVTAEVIKTFSLKEEV